jgi:hypothetical protein
MEPSSQAERLLIELLKGRRLTKWMIRDELYIENVGGRIQDLRRDGWPIATLWLDARNGEPYRTEAGALLVWFGPADGSETKQPRETVAAYQLYCPRCKNLKPLNRLRDWLAKPDPHLKPVVCNECLRKARPKQFNLFPINRKGAEACAR